MASVVFCTTFFTCIYVFFLFVFFNFNGIFTGMNTFLGRSSRRFHFDPNLNAHILGSKKYIWVYRYYILIFGRRTSKWNFYPWSYIYPHMNCSTMGVGCQSRWFNCLFWRETRQRILGHEISPYPEVVRGGEWDLTTRPRERQLVVGQETTEELVAGEQSRRQLRLETTEGSQHQTPEQRGEETKRVQWRRVSRCLIPVALWNFR